MTEPNNNISNLLTMLDSDDLQTRLSAIEILGEIGDEHALKELRKRMGPINRELTAMIAAVGKLKRKLEIK